MQTIAQSQAVGILPFHQALHQVTELARTTLPASLHDRLGCAVTLVEAGHVWLEEDGQHAAVQSLDGARWHAVNAACDCQDAAHRAEGGLCQHRLAVGLVRRAHELMHKPVVLPDEEAPPSGIDPRFLVHLHGKPFIQYQGLLALAHERGLVSLKAHFVTVTPELALAEAEAVFRDGREFAEASDATPGNVAPTVKLHYPRVALTRAKARCLRTALNIGMVAREELGEE